MFDQLLSLVKENTGNVVNDSPIPNERSGEVAETATHSIIDTLKEKISSGNISDVMSMFNGNNVHSSSVAQSAQSSFIDKLMQRFGLNSSQAGGIASSIIPNVLGKLVHKTNDPNDKSFDLSSILSHFGGGNFDVGSVLNKFGLGGGSNSNQGGNITDSLKNMFGN